MKKETVPELFGSMVFDDREMRARLSAKVYRSLRKTIDENQRLEDDVADIRQGNDADMMNLCKAMYGGDDHGED